MGFEIPVQTGVMLGVAVSGGRGRSFRDRIGLVGENTFLEFTKLFGAYCFFRFHFVHHFTLRESDPFLMYAL